MTDDALQSVTPIEKDAPFEDPMTPSDWLTENFEKSRGHLRRVAHRMLGTTTEADDAVQEAWLRVSRASPSGVDNLGGWLTTVVARVCLDMLRSRGARREDPLPPAEAPEAPLPGGALDPELSLKLADSVGPALLVVLETLGPAERVAFVLHDMFDLTFEEVAPIVGRTPEAARQLASRARRRIRGGAAGPEADLARHRRVVSAFLAASRDGNFEALVALLDPDVFLRADAEAVRVSALNNWAGAPLPAEVHGARAVAETFKGRARGAQLALLDGAPGAVWAPGGRVRSAFFFHMKDDAIAGIELVLEVERVAALHVVLEEAAPPR